MPIQQATYPINRTAPGGPASQENFGLFGANYHPDGVVVGNGNELAVTESAVPAMSIDVDTGGAMIDGFFGLISTKATEAVEAADVTNPRIDLFISELSNPATVTSGDGISYKIIKGTAAASPVAPYASLVNTPQLRQKAWKEIRVEANETTILDADITDIPVAEFQYYIGADYPSVDIRLGGTQGLTTAVKSLLTFDTLEEDSFAMVNAGLNRVTVFKAGWYDFYLAGRFAGNGTGDRVLEFEVNGTDTLIGRKTMNPTAGAYYGFTALPYFLNAGDYVEAFALQSSGGDLDIGGGSDYNTRMVIKYRGDNNA